VFFRGRPADASRTGLPGKTFLRHGYDNPGSKIFLPFSKLTNMKLLIFGASGKTGHHLLSQALDQGYQVTAFARNPEKVRMRHENLQVMRGDVADYASVEAAIKGQEVVLSALGASSPFKFDPVLVEGMGNIIKAMQSNNISRLIYLSFVGVGNGRKNAGFVIRNIAPKLLKNEIKGHQQRETLIENSGLQWTIIQAPTLTNGKRKNKYRSGVDIFSRGFVVSVSRSDVADFMLRQVSDTQFLHSKSRIMY
jgi:putative NADH-flavin reductase